MEANLLQQEIRFFVLDIFVVRGKNVYLSCDLSGLHTYDHVPKTGLSVKNVARNIWVQERKVMAKNEETENENHFRSLL